MHTVTKIISGGQTGADRGGLAAGKTLGLQTGGTAPPGFMTDAGRDFSLHLKYGLLEGEYDPRTYPKRTRRNVVDSDGTVLFGRMGSPGCSLTIRCCRDHRKPYIVNPTHDKLREWVVEKNIHVLNVAGNRERTNPGISTRTLDTITTALVSPERTRARA